MRALFTSFSHPWWSNSGWNLFAYAAAAVVSLAYTSLMARGTDETFFGHVSFLMACLVTLGLFNHAGLPTMLYRSLLQGRDATFWPIYRRLRLGGLLLALATPFPLVWTWMHGGDALVWAGAACAFFLPWYYAAPLWEVHLRAKERFAELAMCGATLQALAYLPLAVLVVTTPLPLWAFMSLYLVIWVGGHRLLLSRFAPGMSCGDVEPNWRKAGRLHWLGAIFGTHVESTYRLLLMFLLGAEGLAHVHVAVMFGNFMRYLVSALLTVVFPQFYRASLLEKMALLKRLGPAIALALGLVVVLMWHGLPHLFALLFGETYGSSVQGAQQYLVILPISALAALVGQVLISEGLDRSFAAMTFISGLLGLLGTIAWIPEHGFLGAIWGSIFYFVSLLFLRSISLVWHCNRSEAAGDGRA